MTYIPHAELIPTVVPVSTGSEARPAVGSRPVWWKETRAPESASRPVNINDDYDEYFGTVEA